MKKVRTRIFASERNQKKEKMKQALIVLLGISVTLIASGKNSGKREAFVEEKKMPNAAHYLPAPPDSTSIEFAYDMHRHIWGKTKRHDVPRAAEAQADAEISAKRTLDIYAPIVGMKLDSVNTPKLYDLLCKVQADCSHGCLPAKAVYQRTRPYVYLNEGTLVKEDEEVLRHQGSYPSGHTTYGWTMGLIMMELFPEKTEEIMNRAYEYCENRVVAGFHWQSDVDAARLIASVVVARLHAEPDFLTAMEEVKKEIRKKR